MLKSLYVHIPFCKSKCIYCDFLSFANYEKIIDKYLECLNFELSSYKNEKISTIFVGGGTPSYLSVEQLDFLLKSIKNNFDTEKLKEFTVEANPDSLSADKILCLKNHVNRISLGLQSFDDFILKKIGRKYKYLDFEKKVEQLRDLNFKNINIDLIIGWPFYHRQKNYFQNEFLGKLEKFIDKFYPEHISVYILNVSEKTKLFQITNEKKERAIDEDKQIDEYLKVKSLLKSLNYEHYEISNFSRKSDNTTKNKCLHNLNYWKNKEYIGIGLNASGFINGIRYKNPDNFSKYFEMLENKQNFLLDIKNKYLEIEILTEKEKIYEKIILGLRLISEGLNLQEIKKIFENFSRNEKIDLDFGKFTNKIKMLTKFGYLKYFKNKVKLTDKGICVSNFVISELIDF